MRVFLAVGNRPNQALPASRIWHINLCLPLRDLGHEVIEFDYDLEPMYANADWRDPMQAEFSKKARPRLEAALLEQVRRAHSEKPIDLFLSYFYSTFATRETIEAIADLGIVTMNWYCNASYQFDLVSELAPAYAYSLVPEAFRLDDYRRVGANPIYFQEAANPIFYRPIDASHDVDVAFVGAQYGNRTGYISHLVSNAVDVRVWGPGWGDVSESDRWTQSPHRLACVARRVLRGGVSGSRRLPRSVWGGLLSDQAMVAVYSRARISLGFSEVGPATSSSPPIHQVRLRDFEAPMSGAFYMVERFDEIEQFFVPDREIICFDDKDDLLDKVRFYLTHGDVRERIRLAGHKRALAEHTWQRRFHELFRCLGIG